MPNNLPNNQYGGFFNQPNAILAAFHITPNAPKTPNRKNSSRKKK